jgi:cAMP phosphodiesterase
MLVKDDIPKPAVNLGAGKNSQIDQEAIIEQIWKDLGGRASRTEIKQVVIEVSPRYADARIMTYVPIFLGKEVRRRLRSS